MKVFTSLANGVPTPDPLSDCAVVIDVLRATSVMTSALFHGAKDVVTCRSISAAWRLHRESGEQSLLCGERNCQPIAGFHLGNSPSDYTPSQVQNQRIVLTTTNGTAAVQSVEHYRDVYVVSFLNLGETADSLRHRNRMLLVCSGTEDCVSGEDVLLAGALIQRWIRWFGDSMELCDASRIALHSWRSEIGQQANSKMLQRALRQTLGGKNLIHWGYEQDLATCAQVDSKPVLIKRLSRTPMRFARVRKPE